MKPNINDVSKLDDLRAAVAEQNVSATAIATLAAALKRGMSFERPEDLTILDIAASDAAALGEAVAFGPVTKAAEVPTDVPLVSPAVVDGALELSRVTIEASFQRDEDARTELAKNLARRGGKMKKALARGDAAFAKFDPSSLSEEERALSHHVAPGGDVREAMKKSIQAGADKVRNSDARRSLVMKRTKELDAMIVPANGAGGLVGKADLGAIEQATGRKMPGSVAAALTVYTQCEAEVEADRRMAQIDGAPPGGGPLGPGAENGHVPAAPATDAAALVKEQVGIQMATNTSPETRLAFNVPGRLDQEQLQASVKSLELRDGASDVTAFHDFNTLQIAFPHVWTELFHGDLPMIGRELYAEYAALGPLNHRVTSYPPISSIAELKDLMAEIRNFMSQTQDLVPRGGADAVGLSGVLAGIFGASHQGSVPPPPGHAIAGPPDSSRLFTLLETLENLLSARYSFKVYAEGAVNFGTIVTYRQTWEPKNYQVGDLVSTIPLAPKEIRRYTTRKLTKKTRNVKELEDSLQTRRTESSDTARVDAEIVEKAQKKNAFNLTAHESFGGEAYQIDATQNTTGDAATESSRAKREFRESVIRSAQEYKQQHRMEVDTTESAESEETTFHEIQNPNDELAVTYLFYELQRQYEISERLQKLTPVVLVANKVPAPDEITDGWLLEYDWILRRVILDDSFRPAIEYLTTSFVGAELNIRILEDNAIAQKQLVERLNHQITDQMSIFSADEKAVLDAMDETARQQKTKGVLDTVKGIFDPLGITGKTDDSAIVASQSAVDYAKETLERAAKERTRLLAELDKATSALQTAVDKLAAAVKEHFGHVAEIDRLRVHVKENILYYMQAIWSHEPPDQRFFRIHDLDVPMVEADTAGSPVEVEVYERSRSIDGVFDDMTVTTSLPMPDVTVTMKKLVEVADLDTLLGFKGNYMIFALKENNYVTLHMMQDYLELGDEVALRDPDEFGNYTIDELQRLATCLKRKNANLYAQHQPAIRQAIIDRLTSKRVEKETIVVPTTSLYIEALVGTHPLLEDFKLAHRALDVRKVQSEVRHAELENIRLAARALRGEDEDPDIEKKIVIEQAADGQVVLDPNGD